ncbi:hypothetical protein QAD02_009750 [Eretmocerus hayati]|uniref:Uncharacterized protein n=1 Tax=Eretmocerus hayati TaxID=131215 RepID=A0ACC2NA93_9HYME|nr:hypothetical protein QAD02_009750 [Eretmocerus hayati]
MNRSIIIGLAVGLAICGVVLASHDPNDGTTPNRHPRFIGIPKQAVERAKNGILKYRGKPICGVDFIARNIMLTAARCVFGRVGENITVEINNIEKNLHRIYYHQYFNSLTLENDIAIMSTKEPFPLVEEQILKINSSPPKNYQNMIFSAYYDVQKEGDWNSLESIEGSVQFLPNSKCVEAYNITGAWVEGQLCVANATGKIAGKVAPKKPGTPIVNGKELVGIVSSSCKSTNIVTSIPSVYTWIEQRLDIANYTDVSYYEKWPLTEKELESYRKASLFAAHPNDPEFLVLIEYRGSSRRCVGVIVDERVILTTAECADEADTTTVEVVYAPHKGKSKSPKLDVIDIQIHPNYNRGSIMDPYNVGVMQLAQPVPKHNSAKIKPATRKPLSLDMTKIYGYGENNEMKFLPLRVSPGDECELLLLGREIHSDGKICAMERFGIGIKDQGSPLIVEEKIGQSYRRRIAGLLTPIPDVDTFDYRNPAVFVNLAEGPAYTWILERLSDYAKNSQKISSTTEYSNYINEREDGGL